MGIFKNIFRGFSTRAQKIIGGDDYIWGGGALSVSGEVVNEDTVIRITAVYDCVSLIAQTLATLPLVLYKEVGEGRERAKKHPLYQILHDAPNDFQDSVQFFETMQWHVLLRGNAYAEVMFRGDGPVTEMFILSPDTVRPFVEDGRLLYEVTAQGGSKRILKHNRILHIRGPSKDGIVGLSPIDIGRDIFGSAQAMQKHTGSIWKNGARMGGVLTHPGKLTPAAVNNLRDSWNKQASGSDNSGKTAILENGMKYEPITMTNEQAQFIEEKKMTRSEIASMFHVPPHMIGDLDRATFSNIEQQSLEFFTYTMRPWFVRWERAIKQRLLDENERKIYKAEFNADAILRGDFLTRQQGLAIQRQNGVINIDEWRALENRNPLPEDKGTDHLVPMNMIVAGEDAPPSQDAGGVPNSPGSKVRKPGGTEPKRSVLKHLVESELKRVVFKEDQAIRKLPIEDREKWANEYKMQLKDRILPVFLVAQEWFGTARDAITMTTGYLDGYPSRVKDEKIPTETREQERLSAEIEAFFLEVSYEVSGKAV